MVLSNKKFAGSIICKIGLDWNALWTALGHNVLCVSLAMPCKHPHIMGPSCFYEREDTVILVISVLMYLSIPFTGL